MTKKILLPSSLILFAIAGYIHSRISMPQIQISKQDSAIIFNKSVLYLNLDLKRMISSIMWISTLIESDNKHYKKRDLNSWMYHRFNRILELDPQFLEGYQYGAQYLSIIKDDLVGASDLYERGLKIYPDDYFLNYQAAIHYFNELNDNQKAIPLLERVQDHQRAPAFIKGLIETLRHKSGVPVDDVIKNLEYLRDQSNDEKQKNYYDIKIKRLLQSKKVLKR
jgi:tetratricopeptide (TPR) repeat protein